MQITTTCDPTTGGWTSNTITVTGTGTTYIGWPPYYDQPYGRRKGDNPPLNYPYHEGWHRYLEPFDFRFTPIQPFIEPESFEDMKIKVDKLFEEVDKLKNKDKFKKQAMLI